MASKIDQWNAKRTANPDAHCSILGDCESQREDLVVLMQELRDSCGHYLGKRPVLASTIVFLAGFYVGWKIKP